MFWKIYFWFFIVILVLGYSTEGVGGIWGIIDLLLSIGALAGLFLYAYKKSFFNSAFWKAYLPLFIIWDFTYNLIIEPKVSGTNFELVALAGFLFSIPIYIALYLYAFRFFKGNESSLYEHSQLL